MESNYALTYSRCLAGYRNLGWAYPRDCHLCKGNNSVKILAIENDTQNADPEVFEPYLKSEAVRVWDLYQAEIIRELYFRQDRPEAALVLECENIEVAREVIGTFPLVREGLIAFDLIPLRPYPGFSRLFAVEK